jgi:type IV pilus biogenesis protein CpaD/CtpE
MTAGRILAAVAAIAALLGACATDSGDPTAAESPATAVEVAPDFTLALADGGEFRLSAEQRATFLVFWAEW